MDKYGTEPALLENQLYTLTLKIKDAPTVVSFTSRYSPMFSNVRLVRGDFKQLFSRYTDDEINRMIHDNSKLAIESTTGTPQEFDLEEIPFAVKQYVRYKTEYDIVLDIIVTQSMEGGAQEKNLGELKISKEVNTRDLDKILNLLERRLLTWETQVMGMKGAPTSAVRSGATDYPLNARLF